MAYKSRRRVPSGDRQERKEVKVRGVMERMRRRQRWILVILASLLLVPFGAYGVMTQLLGGRRGPAKGTAYDGERVTREEFWYIGNRMRIALDLVRQRFMSDRSLQAAYPQVSPDRLWLLFRRLVQPEPVLSDDDVWDRFVLLHEAREMGLEVSPAEVDSILAMLFPDAEGGISREAFDGYLREMGGLQEEQARQAVAEDLLVGGPIIRYRLLMQPQPRLTPVERLRLGPKLNRHLTATIQVSDDEVWALFLDARRSYEVTYVGLPAEQFLKDVADVTDAEQKARELEAWYDQHKDRDPDESEDGVGYFLPERCRLHYFVAKVGDLKKTVTVTEKELRDYYETNKQRYRITTRPTTEPATRPGTQPSTLPTTRSATRPRTQPTTVPATAPATRPASRPATRPTTTRALELRPFEEVKDEIRDELVDQRARWAAFQAARKAGNARINLEETSPQGLKVLANRYKMTYVPPKGEVTARQAMEIEGLEGARQAIVSEGEETPRMGQPIDRVFFGRDAFNDTELIDSDGNAYHVWRTGWQKARLMGYSEAREQVERDLKAHKAYERAGARAQELLDELKQLPAETEAPLAELAKKHPGLVVETSKSLSLGSAAYAPRRAAPDADDETREIVRQGVFARLIRGENLQPGQAAVAGDPIARIQYLVRIAKRTEPDLDEFRRARYSYRLWALEQKREGFLRAWLEAVKERANIQPEKEPPDGGKEP